MEIQDVYGLYCGDKIVYKINCIVYGDNGNVAITVDDNGILREVQDSKNIIIYEDDIGNTSYNRISAYNIREMMYLIANSGGIPEWYMWKYKEFHHVIKELAPNNIQIKMEKRKTIPV